MEGLVGMCLRTCFLSVLLMSGSFSAIGCEEKISYNVDMFGGNFSIPVQYGIDTVAATEGGCIKITLSRDFFEGERASVSNMVYFSCAEDGPELDKLSLKSEEAIGDYRFKNYSYTGPTTSLVGRDFSVLEKENSILLLFGRHRGEFAKSLLQEQ